MHERDGDLYLFHNKHLCKEVFRRERIRKGYGVACSSGSGWVEAPYVIHLLTSQQPVTFFNPPACAADTGNTCRRQPRKDLAKFVCTSSRVRKKLAHQKNTCQRWNVFGNALSSFYSIVLPISQIIICSSLVRVSWLPFLSFLMTVSPPINGRHSRPHEHRWPGRRRRLGVPTPRQTLKVCQSNDPPSWPRPFWKRQRFLSQV